MGAPAGGKGEAVQKEQIMEQFKAEMAAQTAQELLQVSDN